MNKSKWILALLFQAVFLFSYAQKFEINTKTFDFEKFPVVNTTVWSRSIYPIDTSSFSIRENDKKVQIKSIFEVGAPAKTKLAPNKTVLILIENHYLPKGVNERAFFKSVLTLGLSGKINSNDKVYVATFDWFRGGQYMFLTDLNPTSDEDEIIAKIKSIKAKSFLPNQQKGSDIYFALDEGLQFLAKIKDGSSKNILMLSDDLPNIASQKTIKEITDLSQNTDIPIYAIGYNIGASRYQPVTENEICKVTNGQYFVSKQNNVLETADHISQFLDDMIKNSTGKYYTISYFSNLTKTGAENEIAIHIDNKKIMGIPKRYPFNPIHWVKANVLLSICLVILIALAVWGAIRLVKSYKEKKAKRLQEIQEKEFQHEQEIKNILAKQRETEEKIQREKAEQIERQEKERLDALMSKKNAFPRITYNHNGMRGEFWVDKSNFTIGRDKEANNFQINIPSVSRRHAAIKFMPDGKFVIQDLGSSNGVLVNGQKIDISPLNNGDLIQLGDVKLKFNN